VETFNLQDCKPHGKIREKIFGAKACKAEQKQSTMTSHQHVDGIVTQKAHSHTQKFLAKIMGKSTSMDSLSQQKEKSKKVDDGMIRHKILSQSTSNICR
jgi:hypothetical protein